MSITDFGVPERRLKYISTPISEAQRRLQYISTSEVGGPETFLEEDSSEEEFSEIRRVFKYEHTEFRRDSRGEILGGELLRGGFLEGLLRDPKNIQIRAHQIQGGFSRRNSWRETSWRRIFRRSSRRSEEYLNTSTPNPGEILQEEFLEEDFLEVFSEI